MLAEALYRTEDYAGLTRLVSALPEYDPLLPSIGAKLASVGLAGPATAAFLRAGDAARAVDACVVLHEWDEAMTLAAEHGYPQVGGAGGAGRGTRRAVVCGRARCPPTCLPA